MPFKALTWALKKKTVCLQVSTLKFSKQFISYFLVTHLELLTLNIWFNWIFREVQQMIKSAALFEQVCVALTPFKKKKTPLLSEGPYHLHSNNELGVCFLSAFNEKALTNKGILNLIVN